MFKLAFHAVMVLFSHERRLHYTLQPEGALRRQMDDKAETNTECCTWRFVLLERNLTLVLICKVCYSKLTCS